MAFHAEPTQGNEESLGVGWNQANGNLEFERAGKKWGDVAFPAPAENAREFLFPIFNVGYFIPACPEELIQRAEASFSDVKGF